MAGEVSNSGSLISNFHHSKMTNKNLRNLLLIPDLKKETIFDVVGRMKVLLDFFTQSHKYKNFTPFLWIYYLITKTVAERSMNGYFRNPRALERLDVCFAFLYFDPLLQFLENGRSPKPWKNYFQYCAGGSGTPFVQMLLGINSHINGDLLTAIITTQYKEKNDFQKINKILNDEIPAMIRFLAFHEHDIYAFGGMVFKQFVQREFKETIVNWRNIVWKNYSGLNAKNIIRAKRQYFNQTEEIAGNIIDIFSEATRLLHIPSLVSKLNSLTIDLKTA